MIYKCSEGVADEEIGGATRSTAKQTDQLKETVYYVFMGENKSTY